MDRPWKNLVLRVFKSTSQSTDCVKSVQWVNHRALGMVLNKCGIILTEIPFRRKNILPEQFRRYRSSTF